MNFTDEEKNKIFNNVRQIEEYLRELQTQVNKPVHAYFETSLDKLCIGKDFIYFDVDEGRNRYFNIRYFNINDIKLPNWYSKIFTKCIYDDAPFALHLLTNWERIKWTLVAKVVNQNAEQERIDNAINNFVL